MKGRGLLILALVVFVPMQIGLAQEKKAPENYMWGINVFHPFPVPAYHQIGEFGSHTPDVLSANHLTWVRFNIKWRDLMPPEKWGVIPASNDPVWQPYDVMIDGLARKGIGLLAIVACGQIDMVSKNPSDVGADEYIKVAGQLTKAIVARYKDRIHYWALENEVNAWEGHASILFRFRKTTDQYWLNPSLNGFRDNLMETLYRSVKDADKDAKTVAPIHYGAWAGEITGFHDSYIPRNYDVLGVTLYSDYMNIVPPYLTPEQVAQDYVSRATKFSTANGRPVIVLETGFPSGEYRYKNPYWTEDGQQRFVSAFATAAMDHTDAILGFYFYRFRDTNPPGFSVTIGSQPQEDFFGLVDFAGRMKPSWLAYGQKIITYAASKEMLPFYANLILSYAPWIAVVAAGLVVVLLVLRRRRKSGTFSQKQPSQMVRRQPPFCPNCGKPTTLYPKLGYYCDSCRTFA